MRRGWEEEGKRRGRRRGGEERRGGRGEETRRGGEEEERLREGEEGRCSLKFLKVLEIPAGGRGFQLVKLRCKV